VQWATDPTWSKLRPATIRRRPIAEDADSAAQKHVAESSQVMGNAPPAARRMAPHPPCPFHPSYFEAAKA